MNADAALYETGTLKDDAGGDVAYVRCTNVKQQLLTALNAHRDNGQLHQFGRLSGNELRATVLGDKGGAYTKLLLTVWDVVDSQSPKNSVLLGMYRGDESYSVIHSAFGPVFDQLAALTTDTTLNLLPSATTASAPVSREQSTRAAIVQARARHTLPGDPKPEALRFDCDYLSPDCAPCRRLLRAGVSQTPQTSYPYTSVQLTYGGDMQWLSKLIGISGPGGRHFCTGCVVSETALEKGRAHALVPLERHRDAHTAQSFVHSTARSLALAKADLLRFSGGAGGRGGKSGNAKLCNNQILEPLIRSEFSGCIAPSPLHVTLGLTQRCFQYYWELASALDRVVLPLRASSTLCSDEQLYGDERRAAEQLAADRDACAAANQQLEMVSAQSEFSGETIERWAAVETKALEKQFKAALKKVTDGEKKLKEIGDRITRGAGPFCRAIETRKLSVRPRLSLRFCHSLELLRTVMAWLGIERQQFHGGAFLGNACHTLLKNGAAFGRLLRLVTFRVASAPGQSQFKCIGIPGDAQRFTTLFRKLYQCHVLYSVARPLCRHEQRALELRCASFGNWFPRRCNDVSLPPKFHLLTQEIPRFAVRWQTVGLASEQAVESSNRVVNRLDRTYTTIQEKETRLAALVKQLALEHNPAVQVILPRVRLCSQCSLPIAARFALRCGCKKRL